MYLIFLSVRISWLFEIVSAIVIGKKNRLFHSAFLTSLPIFPVLNFFE